MTYQPPPPQAPIPPPMPPTPGQVTLKPTWYRRAWVLALAGLIIGIGIGGASASGKTKVETKTVAGPTVTETKTVNITTTVKPTQVIATKTVTVRVTYTPPPLNQVTDGTYVVGKEVPPGIYKTAGGDGCYWARLSSFTTSDIVDNGNITGPTTIQIAPTDKAFEISGGCTWSRVG
jgi:hypothetical protein